MNKAEQPTPRQRANMLRALGGKIHGGLHNCLPVVANSKDFFACQQCEQFGWMEEAVEGHGGMRFYLVTEAGKEILANGTFHVHRDCAEFSDIPESGHGTNLVADEGTISDD